MYQSKFQSVSPTETQIFAPRPRSMSVSSTSTQIITEEGKNRPAPTLPKDHSMPREGPKVPSKLEMHINYLFATAFKKAPYLRHQYDEWLKDWATKVVVSPSEIPESTVVPNEDLKKQIYSYAKKIHDGIIEDEKYWAEYGELEAGMITAFHQWCDKHNREWRHSSKAWNMWKREWSEAIVEYIDIDLPITRLWKQCLDQATVCLGFDHVPDRACHLIIEPSNISNGTAEPIVNNQSHERQFEYGQVERTSTKGVKLSDGNKAELQPRHRSLTPVQTFERLRQVEAAAEDYVDPVDASKQKVWAWMENWSAKSAKPKTMVFPMVEVEALTAKVGALKIVDESLDGGRMMRTPSAVRETFAAESRSTTLHAQLSNPARINSMLGNLVRRN